MCLYLKVRRDSDSPGGSNSAQGNTLLVPALEWSKANGGQGGVPKPRGKEAPPVEACQERHSFGELALELRNLGHNPSECSQGCWCLEDLMVILLTSVNSPRSSSVLSWCAATLQQGPGGSWP